MAPLYHCVLFYWNLSITGLMAGACQQEMKMRNNGNRETVSDIAIFVVKMFKRELPTKLAL